MWNPLIAAVYPKKVAVYFVRGAFFHTFGARLSWWVASIGVMMAILALELGVMAIRRIYFPSDTDLWQEIERQGQDSVYQVANEHAAAEMGQMQERENAMQQNSVEDRDDTVKSDAGGDRGGGVGGGHGDNRPVTGHSFGL